MIGKQNININKVIVINLNILYCKYHMFLRIKNVENCLYKSCIYYTYTFSTFELNNNNKKVVVINQKN